MRRLRILLALLVLSLSAAEHHGTVKFGGLPVPGVTVTAKRASKTLTAITDQQGIYAFPDLADGSWTIQVEMQGFAPIEREIVIVPDAPAAEWDLQMLPFDQIKAAAPVALPATVLSTTTSPAPSPRVNGKTAAAQPSSQQLGFRRADLNAASPVATSSNEALPPANSDTDELRQRAADGFLINGSNNNAASSPFALAPAFGNNRRGGRSLYSGAFGVTVDNAALDARSYSLTGQDTPKPDYNHITIGASFGGPIKIPHVIRNGPNFFVAYQAARNRTACGGTPSAAGTTSSPSGGCTNTSNLLTGLVPTAAERRGDLSAIGGPIIPASQISPQADALLNLYPLPNFDGSTRYNYQIAALGITHQDSLQSRLNKVLSLKNQLSGAFGMQSTRTATPNLFGFLDTGSTLGLTAQANWRHSFTQRLYSNLGVQFSRIALRTTPFFANRANISGAAGITGNNQDPVNWGPPNLTFASGIVSLSDVNYSHNRNQTVGISYDMLWNHGRNNVSFGSDFRRQEFNYLGQQNPRGSFIFTGAATGFDLADFLLGIPDTSSIAFGNADKYFRASAYDAFIQDDWRVGPSFTLDYGVRWEYSSPITERYGRLVNLDIAPGFSAAAPVIATDPVGSITGRRYPDSLVHPDKDAFQPRIGFSWRPLPASSMVVRGGYGVYYNTSVYQNIALQMAQQAPLSKSLSVQNTAASPLTLANGFQFVPGITPATFALDPNFRVGYVHSWQLSIQRDLPAALVATLTYLGNKGTRGMQEFVPNTYPAGAVNPCPSCPTGFIYLTSNGNSTREAGQIQLRRRLHNGFTANLQYTFSKAIDDSALGGRGTATYVIAQDWLNLRAERALSSFDQRHSATIQVQYTTGMGIAGGTLLSGWKGALFKEWTFMSQITAGSGFPLTPFILAPAGRTGITGSLRPNYTGADVYAAPPGLALNPAAYSLPAAGQWGDAGRNSIIGPAQFSLNASVARTFRMSDRFNADLQINATNALNHVTYPNWNTTIGSATFGLPGTANPMRSVQTGLRVRF